MRLKMKGKKARNTRQRIMRQRQAKPAAKATFTPAQSTDFMETVRTHVLGTLPSEEYFVTCDGRSLRSVYELADALGSMSDESFSYHVNEERNDFSAWITESLKEAELGDAVMQCTSRVEMQITLLKFLATRFK